MKSCLLSTYNTRYETHKSTKSRHIAFISFILIIGCWCWELLVMAGRTGEKCRNWLKWHKLLWGFEVGKGCASHIETIGQIDLSGVVLSIRLNQKSLSTISKVNRIEWDGMVSYSLHEHAIYTPKCAQMIGFNIFNFFMTKYFVFRLIFHVLKLICPINTFNNFQVSVRIP